MTSVETISIMIAAVSVVIGVVNSILSNRKAEEQRTTEIETRQAELFANIYNRWNTRDIQTAYGYLRHIYRYDDFEDFETKYSIRPPLGSLRNFDPWFNTQILLTYFEGLGLIVKQRLLDVDAVHELFADRVIWFWEEFFYPLLTEYRKRWGPAMHPYFYNNIEYLYNEMKQREKQRIAVST